jgi:hypothetical protein
MQAAKTYGEARVAAQQAQAEGRLTAAQANILGKLIGNEALGTPLTPEAKVAMDAILSRTGAPAQQPQQTGQQTGQQAPAQTFKPPPGAQFSPSRQQYRYTDGSLHDINGNPVQ